MQEHDLTDGQTRRIEVRPLIGWYLLCAGVIFILIASAGDCEPGGIVYCYGDSRDYWWHPSKFIGALIFSLFLPLPHVLLSLLSKSGRTFYSIASIVKRWHRAFAVIVGIFCLIGILAGRLNSGV